MDFYNRKVKLKIRNKDVDNNNSSSKYEKIKNKEIEVKDLNNKNLLFKNINNLIRIIAFFLIILIPLRFMNLERNQISKIDNRMLLNFEDIFSNGDVFNNIESYIDDRIGFRTEIVDIYTKVMDKYFNEITHPKYEYGKYGFIMSKAEENEFDSEFMEIYSDFIKEFQQYCNYRGIDFLYAVEPRKELIYPEFIKEGYNYENKDLDYFLQLLEEKDINYLNNVKTLADAKERGLATDIINTLSLGNEDIINQSNVSNSSDDYLYNEHDSNLDNQMVDSRGLLFDKEYDARHWNETGAIIGISAILDRLNLLDNRVGSFDINKYKAQDYINDTLVASNFKINEKTIHYNLIEDNSIYIDDLEDEIKRHESFRNFTHYKNESNPNAPRILIFAGSYFDNKEKFLTENFSELMKIHNYQNVLDYEYYINIFNPDMVLFESTEYTHFDFYFSDDAMEDKVHIKSLKQYLNEENLIEDNFVVTKSNSLSNYINYKNYSDGALDDSSFENNILDDRLLEKLETNLTNFSISIDSDDVLFSYAYINNRILDCKINEIDNQKYIEFSIMTSEIKDLDGFDLYFISKDEERYQKISFRL